MMKENEDKILRYAQLAFRHTRLVQDKMEVPPEEAAEVQQLRRELDLSHQQILEEAHKLLNPE